MSTFWKIFISVIITVLVVGGGVFYIMQKQIDKIRSENIEKMEDLNKQIKTLQESSAAATTSTSEESTNSVAASSTATDPFLYTNSKYGFTLTFNSKWTGFELVSATPSDTTALTYLYACVPTTSAEWSDQKQGMFCPFAITVVNKGKRTAFEQANDPLIPTYLKSGDTYAYYYSQAQDQPEDGAGVMADVKNVIATFYLK